MTTPTPQLRRIRRRAAERGTAIFVVLVIITMLTTLGIFAVRSSSLSTMSSGYYRMATQAHYITDYGVTGTVGYLDKYAPIIALKMTSKQNQDSTCAHFGALEQPTCARLPYNEIEKAVYDENNANNMIVPPQGGGTTPGSLGSTPVEADLDIEITDWHEAWPLPAGNEKGNMIYGMVTVSVEGQVRPEAALANQWDTEATRSAGVEQSRAYMVIGPVPNPNPGSAN